MSGSSLTSRLSQAIIGLARAGNHPTTIAAQTGAAVNTVNNVLSRARREGEPVPYFGLAGRPAGAMGEPDWRLFRLPKAILDPHAAARNVKPGALATAIVAAVVAGKLVDAVLDDGVGETDA